MKFRKYHVVEEGVEGKKDFDRQMNRNYQRTQKYKVSVPGVEFVLYDVGEGVALVIHKNSTTSLGIFSNHNIRKLKSEIEEKTNSELIEMK